MGRLAGFLKLTVVLVALTSFAPQQAFGGGIDAIRGNILRYEDLADRYEEAARRIDGGEGLSREYPRLDLREHSCGVLGELLGYGTKVVENWTYPDPGLISTDPHDLRLYALSLRHYVKAARGILQESYFAWRYKWNLNCYGRYNSLKWAAIPSDQDYTLELSEDRRILKLTGDIVPGLYNSLAKRLVIHRTVERIELSSFGGRVSEALKIGRLLRDRKLTTVATGNCNSACTLVFLGGVQRIIQVPHHELGFHRVSQQGTPVWDGDDVYDEIKDYADDMIGDGQQMVEFAKSGTGWDFFRPAKKTLCELGIATHVEDICKVEDQ